jgi:hypothetical protein
MARRHSEATAGAEVILNVDDEQDVVVADVQRHVE